MVLLKQVLVLSPLSAVIRIPMIAALQVCQILLCLTCIQAISRRFLLCVSSQYFGVSSYIPEHCTHQQVVLSKRHTLQMLFYLFFNLVAFLLYPILLFPFFHIKIDLHIIILWTCIFAFRSLSLHRLLRFHSAPALLPVPTNSLLCKLCLHHLHELSTCLLFLASGGVFSFSKPLLIW